MENGKDYLVAEPIFVKASLGKRFVNYMIDVTIFYVLLMLLIIFCYAINEAWADSFFNDADSSFLETLMYYLSYGLYMALHEWALNGRSLGKFITGTKVIAANNNMLQFSTYLKRGLIRLVPFEHFSAFGRSPWHDDWTDTLVIDIAKTKAASIEL